MADKAGPALAVGAVTVTVLVVAEQPALVVNVNVVEPAETPVMTPELSIVATVVLLLIQVPEPGGMAEPGGSIVL